MSQLHKTSFINIILLIIPLLGLAQWKTVSADVDGRILGTAGAGRFTGTMIGMYASSNGKQSTNRADFDWFEYRGLEK